MAGTARVRFPLLAPLNCPAAIKLHPPDHSCLRRARQDYCPLCSAACLQGKNPNYDDFNVGAGMPCSASASCRPIGRRRPLPIAVASQRPRAPTSSTATASAPSMAPTSAGRQACPCCCRCPRAQRGAALRRQRASLPPSWRRCSPASVVPIMLWSRAHSSSCAYPQVSLRPAAAWRCRLCRCMSSFA